MVPLLSPLGIAKVCDVAPVVAWCFDVVTS